MTDRDVLALARDHLRRRELLVGIEAGAENQDGGSVTT
jgi:hypothetical protein